MLLVLARLVWHFFFFFFADDTSTIPFTFHIYFIYPTNPSIQWALHTCMFIKWAAHYVRRAAVVGLVLYMGRPELAGPCLGLVLSLFGWSGWADSGWLISPAAVRLYWAAERLVDPAQPGNNGWLQPAVAPAQLLCTNRIGCYSMPTTNFAVTLKKQISPWVDYSSRKFRKKILVI